MHSKKLKSLLRPAGLPQSVFSSVFDITSCYSALSLPTGEPHCLLPLSENCQCILITVPLHLLKAHLEWFLSPDIYQLFQSLTSLLKSHFLSKSLTYHFIQNYKHLCPIIYILFLSIFFIASYLEEAQAGTKIAGRNINNLRYADDRK